MILEAVDRAYSLDVIQNDLLASSHSSVIVGSNSNPNQIVQLFRKMQTHCDFLKEMDSLADMNNQQKLRELIQNEAYILAIMAEKNKSLIKELKKAKSMANQLHIEKNKV